MPYKDPEKEKEFRRAYEKTPARREYHRKRAKKWREENPEKFKEVCKKSNDKHREKYRPRRNAYLREYTKRKREEALTKYGGKCVCCGEKNIYFLSFDHVNNDGHKERKKIKSSRSHYLKLIQNPIDKTIRILCFNCNMGRQFFGGEHKICPHQI